MEQLKHKMELSNSKNNHKSRTNHNPISQSHKPVVLVASSQDERDCVPKSPDLITSPTCNIQIDINKNSSKEQIQLSSPSIPPTPVPIELIEEREPPNIQKPRSREPKQNLAQTGILSFFGCNFATTKLKPLQPKTRTPSPKKKPLNPQTEPKATKKRKRSKNATKKAPPRKKARKSAPPQLQMITNSDAATVIDLEEESPEILCDASDSPSPDQKISTGQDTDEENVIMLSSKKISNTGAPGKRFIQIGNFKVKHNQCIVEFEIVSPTLFSVTETTKRKQKKTKQQKTGSIVATISQQLRRVLLSVPGSRYDPEMKKMVIPLQFHSEVRKSLHHAGVIVSPIPKNILTIFQPKTSTKDSETAVVDLSGIPPKLLDSLYTFQRRGVVFALRKQGRCLIGDEMGLGKTIQGISIAACYRDEWPLLVICPSSVRVNWSEEFIKWLGVCPLDIRVVMSGKEPIDSLITIVSYDLVPRMINDIEKQNFKIVIADESHYLKNNNAKRTAAIVPILKNAKRVILLTGTPALSRPEEVFTQLDALRPDLFPTHKGFETFAIRYCNGHKGAWGWDTSGASHLRELHCLLCATAMIRRKKLDVLHELPGKQRHTVEIDVDLGQPLREGLIELKKLEQTIHKYKNSNTGRARSANNEKRVLSTLMYVETARTKAPAVQRYLLTMFQQSSVNEKFIVFAHHQDMMDAIEEILFKQNIGHIRIDGSTSGKARQPLVDQFQKRSHCRVALLSVTAGGTGITLNAASSVIFAELYWTPATLLQAEDRAHRIGQKKDVNVYYLLGKGTLDDSIWPLVSRKLDVVGKAIDGVQDQVMGATPVDAPSAEMVPLRLFEDDDDLQSTFAGTGDVRHRGGSSEEDSESEDIEICRFRPPKSYVTKPKYSIKEREPAVSVYSAPAKFEQRSRFIDSDSSEEIESIELFQDSDNEL